MSNNIIYNNNDETIGYYNDLYKVFAEEVKRMLDGHDIEGAKEQMEYLEELSDLAYWLSNNTDWTVDMPKIFTGVEQDKLEKFLKGGQDGK